MKKNVPVIFFLASALLAVILFASGCSASSDDSVTLIVPTTVTTNVIANVTSTSAQTGGYIVFNGGAAVTSNGVCWSTTNQTPTTSDSKKADSVIETTFISQLTGLSPQTTYYVRAYAITSYGTGYGNVIKFTTLATGATAPTGTVSTFAGSLAGGNQNGTGTGALFNNPQGIAADAQGNLYVADSYNNIIRKITPAGVATTLAGSGTLGYANGTGTGAQFYAPQGVAVDATGNVYVADFGNNAIRKITPAGVVTTLAGDGFPGYADGTGSGAVFKAPCGLVVDGGGNVYVTDQGNNLVRKVTSAGVVTTVAGYTTGGLIDSTGVNAAFRVPSGITIDAAGANLYVADQSNSSIRQINIATTAVKTVVSNLAQPKILNTPAGITTDANGNFYFIDATGRVMELTAAKVLYTLAGSANVAGYADGIGAAAQFNSPQSVAVYQGVLYVTDKYNNLIRKVTIH